MIAEDGRTGIAAFKQTDPDLFELDVVMPGLDGYESARVLRGAHGMVADVLRIANFHLLFSDNTRQD